MAMSNFTTRLLTSTILILVVVVLFVLRQFVAAFGLYLVDAVLLGLLCWATWELVNAKKFNRRGANAYVAFVVYALLYFFYLIGSVLFDSKLPWWLQLVLSLVVVLVFALFIGFSNMVDQKFAKECRLAKKNFNKECWGGAWDLVQMILYPGLSFACLILLNHMTAHNLAIFGLLLVVVVSALADMAAYVTGLVLGKGGAKMAPELSPKKTWVGFIGGLIGGVVGALIVVLIISGEPNVSAYLINRFGNAPSVQILFAVVGLVGALMTVAGDLFASFVKRKAGVKDFGHLLPGHGGILDRIDGIIFNAPFILLIMGII